MAIQIIINGESAAQVISELSELSGSFRVADSVKATVTEKVEAEKPKRKKPEQVKQPEPVAEPDPMSEEVGPSDDDAPIPSVVDLRAKAQEVGADPKGKAAVKALLKEFKCAAISSVPEDTRAAFMARLEAL